MSVGAFDAGWEGHESATCKVTVTEKGAAMPIEAELKARVATPVAVMRLLDERAEARVEVYRDTYYDRPDGALEKADEELRVRTVHGLGRHPCGAG